MNVASKELTGDNTVSVGDDVAGEDVLTLVHRAKSGDLAAFDSLMIDVVSAYTQSFTT